MGSKIAIVALLKNGVEVTIKYDNVAACAEDIELLKHTFSDPACHGYIGGVEQDCIVNCRDIAAITIIANYKKNIRSN